MLRIGQTILGAPLDALVAAVNKDQIRACYPIVHGVVCFKVGLDRRSSVLLLLHQYLATVLGAALRSIDVDHSEAQRLRFDLTPDLEAAADLSLHLSIEEMYTCAPQTELMNMLHERGTVRLFAS